MRYAFVIVALVTAAHCQEPAATTPKVFWAEVGAFTASNALDGYTTVRDTNRGWTEVGAALVLGQRPGAVRYSFVEGGIEALTAFACYRLERNRRPIWRAVGHGLMIESTGMHTYGAVYNFRLKGQQ
jgi:hypothetical protein